MKKFKVVDAFCGSGGLSLGLKDAGFDILHSFDNDPICAETLRYNTKYIDHVIQTVDVKETLNGALKSMLNLAPGELDLLAGGPPCQGFSIQRTVGDDKDDRNLLVDDYGDLVSELLPKFFLLENVTGIGGKRGREVLAKFKDKMSHLGYICHERILDAASFGVPQRRKRYILIGQNEKINAEFLWPEGDKSKKQTVRDTISHLPPLSFDGKAHPENSMHRADRLSPKNLERIRVITSGQSRTSLPEDLLANCHKLNADKIGHRNVYGRMAWDDVSPTITAKFDSFTRGKFGHPEQDRSISLLEGALLQTFPEDYVFLGNKIQIARQIGNAVPPLLAKAIGKSIIRALQNEVRTNNKKLSN